MALLIAVLRFVYCDAQSPAAYNLAELYDFKAKTIYGLYQAKNKQVWIATDQGLFNFNGTVFKKHINPTVKNDFHNIQEDKEGRIWCSNFAGQLFYIEDDTLTLFKDVNSYAYAGIVPYTVAHFPKVYIGTSYGYFTTDFYNSEHTNHFQTHNYDKNNYKIFRDNDTVYWDRVYRIQPYENGLLYLKRRSLNVLHENKTQTLFNLPPKVRSFSFFSSLISHNDSIVTLWENSDRKPQIYRYHNQTLETITYDKLPTPVRSIFHYDSQLQKYWMATYSGVVVLDKSLKPSQQHFHFLKEHAISGMMRDHEGNYWVSTLHSGIYIIPSLQIQTLNSSNSAMVKDEIISMIKTGPEQLLLIDNLGNLYVYHTVKNRLIRRFNLGVGLGAMVYNPIKNHVYIDANKHQYNLDKERLESSDIYAYAIKAGTVINSTHFLVSSAVDAHITNFEANPAKKPMSAIWQKQYKFQHKFINRAIRSDTIRYNKLILREARSYTNTICGTTGVLYVSYSDGLFAYATNARQRHITYKGHPLIITALHPDTNKGIWAANTEGQLFYIYKDKISFIINFGSEIKHINMHGTTLFLGSTRGLYIYDTETGEKDVINTLDGLPSDTVTGLAVAGNTIFVATLKGLVKIPTDYRYKNIIPPEVVLTGITVNNKPYPLGEVLELSHKQNTLRFAFSTYALRSRKTFNYAYRMLGIDSTWITTRSNYVNFPGLAPNSYTFEVKAINEDGTESTQTRRISFRIDGPFYQQWWFYAPIFLASTTLIWGFSQHRIRTIKKQNRLEQQKESLRHQLVASTITTLKAQMNPHFMFNAMTAIQSLILDGEQDEAYAYLTKFSSLIRENLNMSEQPFVYFDREVRLIKTYLQLENLRFEKDFEYHIEGAEAIGELKIPAMIIQPFVENAIKHGLLHKIGAKRLHIAFKQEKSLHCIITDNGIGRKASTTMNTGNHHRHTSFASSAIAKRLALLQDYYKSDFGVSYTDLEENNIAKGTKVFLKIPYVNHAQEKDKSPIGG